MWGSGGRLATFGALVGSALVVILAGAGYTLVSSIRASNEALATYADELILAWSLQEAYERKLASGRGFIIAREELLEHEFETAGADADAIVAKLRERVTSRQGILLLEESARALEEHDQALREVMAMDGSREEAARVWATRVRPKATRARQAMDAFIRHKERRLVEERANIARAQQRAVWVLACTVLAALLLALLGGGRLVRSARRTFAEEKKARTAAEQERALFFNLLDQLPLGIVAADPSGNFMHVSRLAQRMAEEDDLPWATAEAIVGRALRGEVVAQEEIRSSSDRAYSVTAGPIRDDDDRIIAAVVAILDISERKRGEKERELFIGALGHDLRNPLQAISLAAASLAQRGDVPEVAKKPAARIVSSARRMNQLISDLLDFARSQHGAIPIRPDVCELREIAADVIAEVKLARPDRDIRVQPEDGCRGRCDRARMAQVFQNLVANAVEHGSPDAPITVRTGGDGDHIWASVTNRGAIPKGELHRIFEPFRSRPKSNGLGLGLYVAKAIVEAHGGTIEADSDEERTTFLVRLPVHAAAAALTG